MKPSQWVVILLIGLAGTLVAQKPTADLVLTNGNIYTGDAKLGRVQALAIAGETIVAAGTAEEIKAWVGPKTRVIDLGGKFVLPGFNDAHTHLGSGGERLLTVNLEGVRSLAEFQQRIRERLKNFQPGEWITGSGWDHSLLKENRIPMRQELDAVSSTHPMIFTRIDGHSVVVNSLALAQAGITRETPNPPGGDIVRDANGDATGWLRDAAMALVRIHVPPPTLATRKRALLLALADAARHGATSAQDNSDWEDFLALRELKQEGKLTLRVTEWLPFSAPVDTLRQMRQEGGTTDPWLKTGALKAMTDGSGGSRTAAMFEPFANDPGNRGLLMFEPEELQQMVRERDAAGFQIALHAIGDRAIRVTLDAFEAAQKQNGRRDARHKIEHVQYVHRQDVPRFRQFGVIASMQPVHLLAEIRWTTPLLGAARIHQAYAVNSLLKAGARVALGTDYPVEQISPLRGIYAASTREFDTGGPEGGYVPDEKITVEQAIHAYTLGSAFAEFEENRKGTLAPGKLADLVVLSNDITRIPPRQILQTEVLQTMVGGRIVYEKK